MPGPKISICLPNRNAGSFIGPRLDSIQAQTVRDWECIVVDGESTDGSWQEIQRRAAGDPRFRLFREPPSGIYGAFNATIQRGTAPYVYIATADDTMAPDCLEKLAAALDRHPECGIAHANVSIIDETGAPVPPEHQWDRSRCGAYFGDLLQLPHIRRAPHDALLHTMLCSIYLSTTQLLVRRSVYARAGLYRSDFGSAGDFEWAARVTWLTDTVHVPDAVATWRVHAGQATSETETAAARLRLSDMVRSAFLHACNHQVLVTRPHEERNLGRPYVMDAMRMLLDARHDDSWSQMTRIAWDHPVAFAFFTYYRARGWCNEPYWLVDLARERMKTWGAERLVERN